MSKYDQAFDPNLLIGHCDLISGFSDFALYLDTQLVQVNLIIMLSLGSMKTDRVISEPCYSEVIYNRHIAK